MYKTKDYKISLVDDGTLDTVVSVTDLETGGKTDLRFSGDCASYYRGKDGAFTEASFASFCEHEVIPDAWQAFEN